MKKMILLTLLVFSQLWTVAQSFKGQVRLNHIALYVVDLKTSTDFYRTVVGLDTIPEPFHDGRHKWFEVGPKSHLHLIQGAASKTDHNKNSHLCFSVASV
ncbi:MAG TPA: VOC family protein, partial [Cyclobacteriaceae bacterium]